MSFLTDLFGTTPSAQPYQQASSLLSGGAKQATKALTTGETTATGQLQQAVPYWQSMFTGAAPAAAQYWGAATGAPGSEAAFMRSIPGMEYQNQLPNIYETALRRGGVTGQTGNIPVDLTNATMSSLNQFYPEYMADLYKGVTTQAGAASGLTGIYGTEATGVTMPTAQSIASVDQWKAGGQAGLTTQLAGQQQAANVGALDSLFGLIGNLGKAGAAIYAA